MYNNLGVEKVIDTEVVDTAEEVDMSAEYAVPNEQKLKGSAQKQSFPVHPFKSCLILQPRY